MVDVYYLDTSALVKKYMIETGSIWIELLTDTEEDNKIIIARVTLHSLRAYDSIQLACALKIYFAFTQTAPQTFTFVSADDRLIIAAQAEGMQTENPNKHLEMSLC